MRKKRDILTGNREIGMALEKREFPPESGNVDTYEEAQDSLDFINHVFIHI